MATKGRLTEHLRARRRGKAGLRWHADETYGKVHGVECYLYRAIAADGNLVDSLLSVHRAMAAAKRFFARSVAVVGHSLEKVTTDASFPFMRTMPATGRAFLMARPSQSIRPSPSSPTPPRA